VSLVGSVQVRIARHEHVGAGETSEGEEVVVAGVAGERLDLIRIEEQLRDTGDRIDELPPLLGGRRRAR
jgi:hypothetical protein